MAKGSIRYKTGQNLEPVAEAITYMGQSASKKDRPEVLGEKIKKISTDATATPAQVLFEQTFYSAGKKQQGNILIAGTAEGPVSVSKKSNYDLSIFPPAKYFKGTTESGILVPIGTLRGQGYALQSEVDAKQTEVNTWVNNYNGMVGERDAWIRNYQNMEADRNNWMNVANSRVPYTFKNYPYIKGGNAVGTITLPFTRFCKIRIEIFESDENGDSIPIFMLRHPNGITSISLPFAYSSSRYSSAFNLYDSSGTLKASSYKTNNSSTFFSMSLNTTYELQAYAQGEYFYLNITPTSTGLTINCKKIGYSGNSYITAWCC